MPLILYTYYTIVASAFVLSLITWKHLHNAAKTISVLLLFTIINEGLTYYLWYKKLNVAPAHHVFSIIEIILLTLFFLLINNVPNKKIWFGVSCIFWIFLALFNIMKGDKIETLNTNILLAESLVVTLLSLFSIYKLFLNGNTTVHLQPLTLIVFTQLLLWGGSFVYWGVGTYLIRKGWNKMNIQNYQWTLLAIVYTGLLFVFLFYPKLKKYE